MLGTITVTESSHSQQPAIALTIEPERPRPEQLASPPMSPRDSADSTESRLAEPGVLEVHVRGAVGLVHPDGSGAPNAYVAIKLAGQKTWKSRVCDGTCDPNWDERMQATGTLAELIAQPMLLKARWP